MIFEVRLNLINHQRVPELRLNFNLFINESQRWRNFGRSWIHPCSSFHSQSLGRSCSFILPREVRIELDSSFLLLQSIEFWVSLIFPSFCWWNLDGAGFILALPSTNRSLDYLTFSSFRWEKFGWRWIYLAHSFIKRFLG